MNPANEAGIVREGATDLVLPAHHEGRGPKARGGVFYNPAMRVARDLTVGVAALEARGRSAFSFLDGLAAAGSRGLRVAHEVAGVQVTLNDIDEKAVALLQANAQRAPEGRVHVQHAPFEVTASASRFDWIDVDPFGTPAPFLETALRSVRHRGVVAATATDTATLCGVYPSTCLRRYEARPLRGPFQHEVGVRILLGSMVRIAARHDRAVVPILSHATDHYMRVYVRVLDGARKADAALERLTMAWGAAYGPRGLSSAPPADAPSGGPLWGGPLADADVATQLAAEVRTRGLGVESQRLADRLAEEATSSPLFTTTWELGRATKRDLPPIDDFILGLREAGYSGTRTHFEPQGVKTDASWDELVVRL